MKLIVHYDDEVKVFEGNDIHKLFGRARRDALYESSKRIDFDLVEETEEDGN